MNVHSRHSCGNIGQPDALAHQRPARLTQRLKVARYCIGRRVFDHAQSGCFPVLAFEAIHLARLAGPLRCLALLRPPALEFAAKDQDWLCAITHRQALLQPAAHGVFVDAHHIGQFGNAEAPVLLGAARINPLHRNAPNPALLPAV